jgi:IclR family acetate operon transcriptional repressor
VPQGHKQTHTEEPPYPIGSVDNALQTLELIRETNSVRVTDISKALGIARSSAHRLLAMLAYRGYVRQDPETKAYLAGPALVELGLSVVRNMNVRQSARPLMERLVAETGETTSLVLLDGAEVLFVDCVEGTRSLRVASRTGMTMPAHCTAPGKVMLADLSRERLRELYAGADLPTMTPNSLSTFEDLESELVQIRRLGYATNVMESEQDTTAVALALRGPSGITIAAVSVAGPVSRLTRERMRQIAEVMKIAIEEFGPLASG